MSERPIEIRESFESKEPGDSKEPNGSKEPSGRKEPGEAIRRLYERWRERAKEDREVADELAAMENDFQAWEEAFGRELSFGTGGLRGILGAGTNRMNLHTVARASQGLAHYIRRKQQSARIAISYDSRIKSRLFAETAAGVLAANELEVYLYPELAPTPCLSFAVRYLGCAAGVMVTASHNPANYNGYKVYQADGSQITGETAAAILAEIQATDMFDGVKRLPFSDGLSAGRIHYIGDEVMTAFLKEVKAQSLAKDDEVDKDISIVYSPLNGTGRKPVLRALRESGYTSVTVVKEQEEPDGHFPTCPKPNPEVREAMELGLSYAARCGADLVLATDPDCDRVGIAVPDTKGSYVLLSGNETGVLLLDYICRRRVSRGQMPKNPLCIKTIVTTDLAKRVASHYGVRCLDVLTGFKYIGEQIGRLEAAGSADSFLFGLEESYGYLSGSYVRDKDGVGASLLICEMCAWYRHQGIRLWERLMQLYEEYGYCLNTQHSFAFAGASGLVRMQKWMEGLRNGAVLFREAPPVISCTDYAGGHDGLPASDVLKYELEGGSSVVIRPSGTEPKLKAYISVQGADRAAAGEIERRIARDLQAYMT